LIYLPPYSPDFNPIEECFCFVKHYIQCHGQEFQDIVENGDKAGPFLFLYAALDQSCLLLCVAGFTTLATYNIDYYV